jgi:polyisoprenoid-binding protein YceI
MESADKKKVWMIDPVHSKIRFEARYLMLTAVTGWFPEIEGKVFTTNERFDGCGGIQLTLYTNSLTTMSEARDQHLRSADFFDTAKYPTMRFFATEVKVSEGVIHVVGNLTIKNITQRIQFDANFVGVRQDPYGNKKAGVKLKTTIDRKDFDITWNNYFDKEGILLSDDIDIIADIQLLLVD